MKHFDSFHRSHCKAMTTRKAFFFRDRLLLQLQISPELTGKPGLKMNNRAFLFNNLQNYINYGAIPFRFREF